MSDLRVGDKVEFTVEAEVVFRYEGDRVELHWHSGEEIVHPSDMRLKNNG